VSWTKVGEHSIKGLKVFSFFEKMDKLTAKEFIENIMVFLDGSGLLSFLLTCKFFCEVGLEVFKTRKGWKVDLEQFTFLSEIRKNIEDINFDSFFYAGSSIDLNRYRLETGKDFPEKKEKCLCSRPIIVDHIFIEKEKGWVIDLCSFCSGYFDKTKRCRNCWKAFNGVKYIFCPACRKSVMNSHPDDFDQYKVKKCGKCQGLYQGYCDFCDRGRLFRFGKHEGETIDEVREYDPGYLSWLTNSYIKNFKNPKSRFYRRVNIVIENILKDEGEPSPSCF
jgi:hypothetical protein